MLRRSFTPGVILGIFLVALGLAAALFGLLWVSRPGSSLSGFSTAVLNVTRLPETTPTPNATSLAGQSSPSPETPEQVLDVITVGGYVQVQGTGGAGLRIRSEAGLSQGVRFLAKEAETFQVKDGPKEVDGYTWWYLVSSDDQERWGWAVETYLKPVSGP